MCISLYDIIKEGPCFIFPGEGSYQTPGKNKVNNLNNKVEFRCIVFRPFVNEIITGKVIDSSKKGLKGKVI